MKESRLQKSILNARVNFIFILISVFIAFFSRRIFIENLGVQFIGLTTTLQSFLGFLNIAELGVGTAISVVLFKPLAKDDKTSICEIVSVLAYMYRCIGLFILAVGIFLSFFLFLFYKDAGLSFGIVYFAYYAFLGSSLITYFINYKQTLLSADQRNYVVVKYLQTSNIIKLLLQMFLSYYYASVYLWVLIEFVFGVIYCIILNKKIKETYPWLRADVHTGKKNISKYPLVKKYIRQLFIQKISGFSQSQISPLLIFAYVSLSIVTYYGNYTTIVQKLSLFVNAILGSTEASIGNLIADKDRNYIINIYKEMIAIRFLIAGFFVFMLYNLIQPFISLWLGSKYLLNNTILILILGDVFITQHSGTTLQFLYGYGLFKDVWASVSEVVIYIVAVVTLGYFWHLEGILFATIFSKVIIQELWKPYFLFSQGFKISCLYYWKIFINNLAICIIAFIISSLLIKCFITSNIHSFIDWIIYALIIALIYLPIDSFLMYFCVPGTKSLCKRFIYKLNIQKQ